MAAACSAALHVVGQKCCDDGTARLATFCAKRGLSALSLALRSRKQPAQALLSRARTAPLHARPSFDPVMHPPFLSSTRRPLVHDFQGLQPHVKLYLGRRLCSRQFPPPRLRGLQGGCDASPLGRGCRARGRDARFPSAFPQPALLIVDSAARPTTWSGCGLARA